jgi:hypothetical protein
MKHKTKIWKFIEVTGGEIYDFSWLWRISSASESFYFLVLVQCVDALVTIMGIDERKKANKS